MDDFERELRDMLGDRVASMEPPADASPQLLTRARRRRAAKLTALAVSVVVVAGGTAGAIAQVARDDRPHQVITSIPPRPSVQTVVCPAGDTAGLGAGGPPAATPRTPTAGDPDVLKNLVSYAASDDPRYVVLGPESWTCQAKAGQIDEMGIITAGSEKSSILEGWPIAIVTVSLGDVSPHAKLVCLLPDESRPSALCDPASSIFGTVTRVNDHLASFVAGSGARGVGWTTGTSANDSSITILTCRPTTGLTAAECDTIVADYAARLTSAVPPPTATTSPSNSTTTTSSTSTTTTTTPLPASVATTVCPMTYALTDHTTAHPSSAPRVPAAGDPTLFSQLASFAADNDPRFVALGPTAWLCEGQMGADGDNAFVVYQTAGPGGAVPDIFTAPIAIENDWLWHGLSAIANLCKVSTDPAVISQAAAESQPCAVPASRTLTPVDAHASTFVDADGARGAAWFVLPSSTVADGSGKLSIFTCRPTTDLTAAECDTIIADWLARNDTTG